jgi:hypothetical protein
MLDKIIDKASSVADRLPVEQVKKVPGAEAVPAVQIADKAKKALGMASAISNRINPPQESVSEPQEVPQEAPRSGLPTAPPPSPTLQQGESAPSVRSSSIPVTPEQHQGNHISRAMDRAEAAGGALGEDMGQVGQRLSNLGHSRPSGEHFGEQLAGGPHGSHAEARRNLEAWARGHMTEHKGCTGSLENFYCPVCRAPYTMVWWDEHGHQGEGHCPHTD